MPLDRKVEFLAVDEIQLCADPERGHVFTHRLLHARGTAETMLMGAATVASLIRQLCPEADIQFRERFSQLDLRRSQEADAPAAAQRRRRLLRRRGLRHRRAHPPSARRGGGGHGIAQSAHPQRAGESLPVRRGRVPGRDRRDRDGTEHGRRSCRVRGVAQVRRTAHCAGSIPMRSPRSPGAPAAFAKTARSASPATRRTSTRTSSRAVEGHVFPPVVAAEWRNARLDFQSLQGLMRSLAAPPPAPGLQAFGGKPGRDDAAPAFDR